MEFQKGKDISPLEQKKITGGYKVASPPPPHLGGNRIKLLEKIIKWGEGREEVRRERKREERKGNGRRREGKGKREVKREVKRKV